MRRMAEVTNVSVVTRELEDDGDRYATDPNAVRRRVVPEGVEVYEINGPFFFGAAEKFKSTVGQFASKPKAFVVRMRNVLAMDSTGMHALRELVHRSRKDGTLVILSDVHTQPLFAMERAGLLDEVGEDNVFGNIDDALNRAREHLELPPVEPPPFATPTVAREATPAPTRMNEQGPDGPARVREPRQA
jgi:SulP family sulfate permease